MTSDSEDTSECKYTITVNKKEFELNESVRRSVQDRARNEYSENGMFSCWWKVASPDQYSSREEWDETVHESGDPVLVIETEGRMVPWSRLDTLSMEMQNAEVNGGMNSSSDARDDTVDSGNGMRSIDPSDVTGGESSDGDSGRTIGRTHFQQEPRSYDGVESPDGEEEDKIPPAPMEMPDEPMLVKWLPDHPDVTHTWAAGEAIIPVFTRVEWNVQVYADQPLLGETKNPFEETRNDRWENMMKRHDCDKVGEISVTETPGTSSQSNSGNQTSSSSDVEDIGGKYNGGGNWHV